MGKEQSFFDINLHQLSRWPLMPQSKTTVKLLEKSNDVRKGKKKPPASRLRPPRLSPISTPPALPPAAVITMEGVKVSPKKEEAKSDPKKASIGNEETTEDSPIMGVLTLKAEVGTEGSSLSESTIQKAILKRADHILANAEKISLAGVRRLLEKDLKLDEKALDAFKDFISQQVQEVLQGPESVEDDKEKGSENVKSKPPKKVDSKEDSETDTSRSGHDEMGEKVKLRKEAAPRRNIKKLERPKKRIISNDADIDVSFKKQKTAKRQKEEVVNSDEDGSISGDGQSHTSSERPALLRREKSAPGYGKHVENLKSVIKACGMSVPPHIYKKVKQVPDDERETFLVKELEGILSKEGLSKNPTEKEIKDCRKRKEKARELEGIDTSNIIRSSRRRSTFSFATPGKPGIHAKDETVDSRDSKKKDNDDKDLNDDNKEDREKDKDDEEEEKDRDKKGEYEEKEEDDEEEEEEDDEDESEEFDEDDNEESD